MRANPIGESVIRATWKRYRHFIVCEQIVNKFYNMKTYDKDKKDLTKIPRGSTNQKIIDMRRTVKNHYTPREIDYNQFLEN